MALFRGKILDIEKWEKCLSCKLILKSAIFRGFMKLLPELCTGLFSVIQGW